MPPLRDAPALAVTAARRAMLAAVLIACRAVAADDGPYELASFPRGSDAVVDRCYTLADALADRAAARCGHARGDPRHHWLCPAGEAPRVAALDRCRAMAPSARDQPAMLYLLGLEYLDLSAILNGGRCPRDFRYQEGSSVCVYTGVHFRQLIAKYPRSDYADMAAAKIAQTTYRYYECEGGIVCAVENGVAGWVPFLEARPSSRYAPLAVREVVEALGHLANPQGMNFEGYEKTFREDLRRLDVASARLPADLRAQLREALAKARADAERLDAEREERERK